MTTNATDTRSEGDRARELAAERGITVTAARKIVNREKSEALRADRQSRGVHNYVIEALSPKVAFRRRVRIECKTDEEAVEKAMEMVRADGYSRQVVCNETIGLVCVVTK